MARGRKVKRLVVDEQQNEQETKGMVVQKFGQQPVQEQKSFDRYCVERNIVGTAIAIRGAYQALRIPLKGYEFSDYELRKIWLACEDLHNSHIGIEPDTIHADLMNAHHIDMANETILHLTESSTKNTEEAVELAKSLAND